MGKVTPVGKTVMLEKALREQADSLDPAQKEFVLAQFDHYKWNEEQIAKIQRQYEACSQISDDWDVAERKSNMAMRASLFKERHQLVAEQGTLFSHIMRWIKGTAAGKSLIDEFLD